MDEVECFAADRVQVDGGWLYDVTKRATPADLHPAEQCDDELRWCQRATRYLMLRGRVRLVEHDGRTWVRITDGAEA